MAEIQITTTQNVNLNFKAAELNHRMFAWLIDSFVKGSYMTLLGWFIFDLFGLKNSFDTWDYWSKMALFVFLGIPVIFYSLVLETLFNGQTVGKMLLKIKVLKIDGYQTDFVDFFIRWVMRIVDVSMSSGFLALIFIGSSKKSQRLGGMASGTVVVSLRNKINISNTILEESVKEGYKPTFASVVKLSDNDVRIIKENYLRAKVKDDHGLLLKLREKIIMVTNVEPLEGQSSKDFIDMVIKDYNYFTQKM